LNTTWEESVIKLHNQSNRHRVLSNLELIIGVYGYFVTTGIVLLREKFTRVKEETKTDELGLSHLFLGRFNTSGLNNDG